MPIPTLMTPNPSRFPTRMLEDLEMGLDSIIAQEAHPGAMERLRAFRALVVGELDRRRHYRAILASVPLPDPASVVVDIGGWRQYKDRP